MVTLDRDQTIKKLVFDIFIENPYLEAVQICKKLNLSHKKHGQYVRNLTSQFRCNPKIGLPLKPHNRLPHKRIFHWIVSRELLYAALERMNGSRDRSFYQGLGWVHVKNRNGMLVYRESEVKVFYERRRRAPFKVADKPATDFGSIHWFQSGKVIMYLRGEVAFARAKEFFCKAFWFLTDKELSGFVDAPLIEKEKHWVFEVGSLLPRFEIRQFERSHGLRFFVDGSHPTSVEARETEPWWIGELRETTAQLAVQISEHLKLVSAWQKESAESRKLTRAVLKLVKALDKK